MTKNLMTDCKNHLNNKQASKADNKAGITIAPVPKVVFTSPVTRADKELAISRVPKEALVDLTGNVPKVAKVQAIAHGGRRVQATGPRAVTTGRDPREDRAVTTGRDPKEDRAVTTGRDPREYRAVSADPNQVSVTDEDRLLSARKKKKRQKPNRPRTISVHSGTKARLLIR